MTLRDHKGETQFKETRTIDLDGLSVAKVQEHLDSDAEGLTDARLVIESYLEYGETCMRQAVEGWRKATDQEIVAAEQAKAAERGRQRAYQDRQLEQLRKERPEAFK